jgi:hypothetical protein
MPTHAAVTARPAMRVPALRRYANHSGHSGVAAYAIRGDGLLVEFNDGKLYFYSLEVPGRRHVERMQSLAEAGTGLSTYISRHIGRRYAARLR